MILLPWGNLRSGISKVEPKKLNSPPFNGFFCCVLAAGAARPACSWLPCACASARTALGACYCPCALSTSLWVVLDAPAPDRAPPSAPTCLLMCARRPAVRDAGGLLRLFDYGSRARPHMDLCATTPKGSAVARWCWLQMVVRWVETRTADGAGGMTRGDRGRENTTGQESTSVRCR